MKTLDQIAAELQGYDPQALPAHTVNAFLVHIHNSHFGPAANQVLGDGLADSIASTGNDGNTSFDFHNLCPLMCKKRVNRARLRPDLSGTRCCPCPNK